MTAGIVYDIAVLKAAGTLYDNTVRQLALSYDDNVIQLTLTLTML